MNVAEENKSNRMALVRHKQKDRGKVIGRDKKKSNFLRVTSEFYSHWKLLSYNNQSIVVAHDKEYTLSSIGTIFIRTRG